jgi:hypothetical protein
MESSNENVRKTLFDGQTTPLKQFQLQKKKSIASFRILSREFPFPFGSAQYESWPVFLDRAA